MNKVQWLRLGLTLLVTLCIVASSACNNAANATQVVVTCLGEEGAVDEYEGVTLLPYDGGKYFFGMYKESKVAFLTSACVVNFKITVMLKDAL